MRLIALLACGWYGWFLVALLQTASLIGKKLIMRFFALAMEGMLSHAKFEVKVIEFPSCCDA